MSGADSFDWSRLDRQHPARGDVAYLQGKASAFDKVRDDGAAVVASLRGVSQFDDIWEGEAAQQFRSTLNRLIEALDKLVVSYSTASTALRVYVEQLVSAKGIADNAALKADEALADREWALNAIADAKRAKAAAAADLEAANDDLERAQRDDLVSVAAATQVAGVSAPVVQAQSRRGSAQSDLASARSSLSHAESAQDEADARVAGAKSLADQAQELLEGAGRTLKEALRVATEEGVRNKSLFEQAWDATGGKIVTATADAAHWLSDVENLKKLSSILGTIGKWLGYLQMIFFWVPVIGPALAIASLAVAGMKFIVDFALWKNGELSWQGLAVSGLGVGLAALGAKGSVTSLKQTFSVAEVGVEGTVLAASGKVGDNFVGAAAAKGSTTVTIKTSGEGVSFFRNVTVSGSASGAVATGPAGTRMVGSIGPRAWSTSGAGFHVNPMELVKGELKEVVLSDAADLSSELLLGTDENLLIDDVLKAPFTPPGSREKNLIEAAK